MNSGMLANAVLSFASAAAQVWAALMVFQVLLVRDLCRYRGEEESRIIDQGRGWLGVLLSADHKDCLMQWSADLDVDLVRTLVRTAGGDVSAEFRLLRAVSSQRFFERNAIGGVVGGLALSPGDLQARVDALVARLEKMSSEFPAAGQVFQTGFTALALNLGGLAAYALAGAASSLVGLLGALVVGNFALGWRFARQIHHAMVCY